MRVGRAARAAKRDMAVRTAAVTVRGAEQDAAAELV
jgi:hypothetical protein